MGICLMSGIRSMKIFWKKTIEPEKLVIVVVGEAEKLKGELEKIASVTVIAAEK